VQEAYNLEHGITPASIIKAIDEGLTNLYDRDYSAPVLDAEEVLSQDQLESRIEGLQAQMKHAAANLDFERAATLRDRIKILKGRELGVEAGRGSRS
jgi:excinuclease ABC subunit B